jgi:WD40 repeat protein
VAFSPDGSRIASASWDLTVKVWDARSGTDVATLRGHAARHRRTNGWGRLQELTPRDTVAPTVGGAWYG